MLKNKLKLPAPKIILRVKDYLEFLRFYLRKRGYLFFSKFEIIKNAIVDVLYKKRGRYSRPFLHFGTTVLVFFMFVFGPMIMQTNEEDESQTGNSVLFSGAQFVPDFYTLQAEEVKQYRGGEIIEHVVSEGETISSIAERYGLNTETILWQNNLKPTDKIKPGMELEILPIDGIRHKVSRGETINSIGKKYGLEGPQIQAIIDYPFNEFLNDETFDLVAGQYLMVPDGVMPQVAKSSPRSAPAYYTPDRGTVTASGQFVWPAAGRISQGYKFYHKAIDIANRSGGPIVAADSGVVVKVSMLNYGYGYHIIVDHGNGFMTLYAHLSVVQVKSGQRVNKGDVVGQMGNTGRSTGTHLHFEIRNGGTLLNPMNYL